MLRNRIETIDYKELTPTVIFRKSRNRVNVMAIVANRLGAIKKRSKGINIAHPNEYAHLKTYKNRYTKGGFAVNRNGMPININGKNPLTFRK